MMTPVGAEPFSQPIFSPTPLVRQNNVSRLSGNTREARAIIPSRWGALALRILSVTSYLFKIFAGLFMAIVIRFSGRNVSVISGAQDLLKLDTRLLEARKEGITRKINSGGWCSKEEQTLLIVISCILSLKNTNFMEVNEMKPTAIARTNGESLFAVDFRRRQSLRVEHNGRTQMIEAVGRSHTDLLKQVKGETLSKRFGMTSEEWHHALEFTLHSVPAVPLSLMQEACQSRLVVTIEDPELLIGDGSEQEVTGLTITDDALVASYKKKMRIVRTNTMEVLGTITLSVEYKFVRGALRGETITEADDNLYEGSWTITDFTIFS